MSRSQRLSLALSALNLVLLAAIVLGHVPVLAAAPQQDGILRGRGLEIVDARGVVRLDVNVEAPTVVAGKQYPDRVQLRMATPGAGPGIKIVNSAAGTEMIIMHNDRPIIRLAAHSDSGFMRITDVDGKSRTIAP